MNNMKKSLIISETFLMQLSILKVDWMVKHANPVNKGMKINVETNVKHQ